MTGRFLTRRALCLGLSAGLLARPFQASAREAAPGRVAALGWVPAQTALALGVAPVLAPEIALYDRLVVEPAMPPGTPDAGLRSEPNLERLVMLRPDLILTDESLSGNAHRLSRIAPVFAMETRRRDMGPLQAARLAMRALAGRLDRRAEGRAYEERLDAMLEETAARLRSHAVEPLYLVGELPATRALVFGRGSLYQDVLDRLGLVNAWDGPTTAWGHATVSPDALSRPGARMLFVSSRLPDVADLVRRRPLWQTLPFVREDRITIIPDVLFYGGLPSALRFTRFLAAAFGGGHAKSRA